MMPKNNWRQQSLGTLENRYWGDPATAPSNLVKRCIELSMVPVHNPVSGIWYLAEDFVSYEHSSASFYEEGIIKHFEPKHYKSL